MEKYQLNCKNIHKLPGGSVTAVMNLLFYHGLSEAGQPVRIHEEKPVITQFMDKSSVKVSGRVVARCNGIKKSVLGLKSQCSAVK